jgi:IS5 family transposase
MQQKTRGLFDIIFHFEELPEAGDPLILLNKLIDWEIFRPLLNEIRKPNSNGKGRPPFDDVLMFKVIVLQSLNNVSDDKMEFLIKDRLSFMRFLGFQTDKPIFPDAKTIWHFKEQLKEKGLMKKIFYQFDKQLQTSGIKVSSGKIIDATVIEVPRQRNKKEDNNLIKKGEIPADWKENNNKLSQKDVDARWYQKRGQNYFGYKNHISIDKKSKLIKDFDITSANVYDGIGGIPLIQRMKPGETVYADSAYSNSIEFVKKLKYKKLKSKLCSKGYKSRPLRVKDIKRNRSISHIRARVEHVFGDIHSFSRLRIRSIGMDRAKFNIALQNLTYNIRRFCFISVSQ